MEKQYKDSGIEWIGKIPETWEVDIAKHAFKQRREKGNDVECQLLAATQKNGMYPQHLLEGVVKVAADTDLNMFKTVHKNDYVISLRSFQGGFEMSDYEGVCSPAYQVFYATRRTANQYYKYLFKSDAFIQEINSLTVGIREGKNILYDDFALLPIPIPTVDDQQHIAEYLDSKCGEIDSLIALQMQMIEKLKAYKQSVITEAVTKSLDPNAKLVPSGIDWIGEIPEGWKVYALKWLMDLYAGATPKSDDSSLWDGEISWITPADYKTEDIYVSGGRRNISQKGLESCATTVLPKGSIVFSKRAPIGLVAINDRPLCTNQGCIGCIVNSSRAFNKFFYYTLSVYKEQFELYGSGTTFKEISATKFANFMVPVPPLSEQQTIAAYLDEKCADIDRLISLKQQKIESLKDYKKSVIYEAVTGKTEI